VIRLFRLRHFLPVAAALALTSSSVDALAQAVASAGSSRKTQTDPGDTRIAFVNIERVADESVVGKALAGRVDVLNQQKAGELNEKRNALQAAQQKLESAASVLSPNALVLAQIDIQRFTEDAQADNPRPARTAPERVRGPGALTLNQDGQLVTCRSRERRIKSYCS
jgi:hypothetical protein